MCRFAGVPTPKSVSEFIRDTLVHRSTFKDSLNGAKERAANSPELRFSLVLH